MFENPNVTIHTDHEPPIPIFLKSLLKVPKQLQAMLMALQRYPTKIEYRPGIQLVTTDMLSNVQIDKAKRSEILADQKFHIETFLCDLDYAKLLHDLPVTERLW